MYCAVIIILQYEHCSLVTASQHHISNGAGVVGKVKRWKLIVVKGSRKANMGYTKERLT